MEETTKLGRCECEDTDCVLLAPGKGAKTDHTSFKSWRCQRDAVRMVKAERVTMRNGILRESMLGPKWTWMCAACADFHEKGGLK